METRPRPERGPPTGDALPIGRRCAAALLICGDRYLMQLRDDKPTILLPNHWALFGGTIEIGETPIEAVRRELLEELELHAREVQPFTEMIVTLPLAAPRRDHMSIFAVPIEDGELGALVQHEGAGRALFTADALAREARVAPWDLAAVLMHARQGVLFTGG